jgi:hypothetical protein
LILTPRVDQGVREAFLGAIGKRVPQKADMPVMALHTALEEDLPEKPPFLCRRHLAHLLTKPEGAESLGSRHAPVCRAGKADAVDHRNGIVQGSAHAARLQP